MAGNLDRLLSDVEPYVKSTIKPPISENSQGMLSRVGATFRSNTWSRLGKLKRQIGVKGSQKLGHSKRRMGTTLAKIGVTTGVSKAFMVVGGTLGAALTVKTAFLPVAAMGAAWLLRQAYKSRKYSRELKMYDDLENHPNADPLQLLGSLLSSRELAGLCSLVERVERSRGKLDTELRKWDSGGGARLRKCSDSVLLEWRYGWYKRLLKDNLDSCDTVIHLRAFNDRLDDVLHDVADDIVDCGIHFAKAASYGLVFPKRPSRTAPAAVNASDLPSEGLVRWPSWMREVLRTGHYGRANDYGYFAEALRLAKAEAKFTPEVAAKAEELQQAVQQYFASTHKRLATRTTPKTLIQIGMTIGVKALSGLPTSQIGTISAGAAASGGVHTAAALPINMLIDLTGLAINDKINTHLMAGVASGKQMPVKERLWTLRSILETGRLSSLVKTQKKLKSDIDDLKGRLAVLREIPRRIRGFANQHQHALPIAFPALTLYYQIYRNWLFCSSMAVWTQTMVDTITDYLGMRLEEQDGPLRAKVVGYLETQIACDHTRCRGTCYGFGENGVIFPLP